MDQVRETDEALTLTLSRQGGITSEVRWLDIVSIVAFKQDLFNPTIVILELLTTTGRIQMGEADCGGYGIFTQVLERHLRGVVPYERWWAKVTNPLTYHQDIVIYRREPEAG
jgi:hypothetical protein